MVTLQKWINAIEELKTTDVIGYYYPDEWIESDNIFENITQIREYLNKDGLILTWMPYLHESILNINDFKAFDVVMLQQGYVVNVNYGLRNVLLMAKSINLTQVGCVIEIREEDCQNQGICPINCLRGQQQLAYRYLFGKHLCYYWDAPIFFPINENQTFYKTMIKNFSKPNIDYILVTFKTKNEIPNCNISTNLSFIAHATAFNCTNDFIEFVNANWTLYNYANASINSSYGKCIEVNSGKCFYSTAHWLEHAWLV